MDLKIYYTRRYMVTQPSSSKNIPRNKHKPRSFSEVWDYFVKGVKKNNGHYEAICSYCKKIWSRGKRAQLEAHLANECASCPDDISRYWREKVAERDINYTRRPKKSSALPNPMPQTTMTSHYMSDCPLTKAITSRLDQKIIKAWVMAGIPFDIIDNLFIRDMFKEFNPAYSSPSRTTLSNRLFDEELA
ncbi:hypothetical protein C2G38_2049181 [Gigaspora rosea]|uniref:BED-type domain-containing protein n=1 Tax=Gigaspora rosea TaxID=44941 RepID=A0A397U333_9GLOM|nr:hypothetical protein C2G38_2049181 [Gigaspora rosea]